MDNTSEDRVVIGEEGEAMRMALISIPIMIQMFVTIALVIALNKMNDKMESEVSKQSQLRIGNQSPGLRSLLTFDIQDKHLAKSCKLNTRSTSSSSTSSSTSSSSSNSQHSSSNHKSSSSSSIEPQFTVYKYFNLINPGKIPVRVYGFFIGPHLISSSYKSKSTISSLTETPLGYNQLLASLIGSSSCSGFGFKVLNCENLYTGPIGDHDTLISDPTDPSKRLIKIDGEEKEIMIVNPNESYKIHIAFTPDFTIAKSMATLTIYVNDPPSLIEANGGKDWIESIKDHFLGPLINLTTSSTGTGGSDGHRSAASSGDNNNNSNNNKVAGGGGQCTSSKCEGHKSKTINSEIATVSNTITYSLIATIPKSLMVACDKSLPRPYQETILYYILVVFMTCLILVSVTLSFFDGSRILNYTFYPAILMTRAVPAGHDGTSYSSSSALDGSYDNGNYGKPPMMYNSYESAYEPSYGGGSGSCPHVHNNHSHKKKGGGHQASVCKKCLDNNRRIPNLNNHHNSHNHQHVANNINSNTSGGGSYGQSWSSFLKEKFSASSVAGSTAGNRRGSNGSGSANSSISNGETNNSSIGKGSNDGNKSNVTNRRKNKKSGAQQNNSSSTSSLNTSSISVSNGDGCTPVNGQPVQQKKKSSARLWLESLSRSSSNLLRKKSSEEDVTTKLPTFESTFDEEEVEKLKGIKSSNSKTKNKTVTTTPPVVPAAAVPVVAESSTITTLLNNNPAMNGHHHHHLSGGSGKKQPLLQLPNLNGPDLDNFNLELPYNPGKNNSSNQPGVNYSILDSLIQQPGHPLFAPSSSNSANNNRPPSSSVSSVTNSSSSASSSSASGNSSSACKRSNSMNGSGDNNDPSRATSTSPSLGSSSLFDSNDFGYWSNEAFNGQPAGKKNKNNKNDLIWDSPITMFDSEKAMSELIEKRKRESSANGPNMINCPNKVNGKSGLCSFVPPNVTGLPAKMTNGQHQQNKKVVAVGPTNLSTMGSSNVVSMALNSLTNPTPDSILRQSPKSWSPSLYSSSASDSHRKTESPIASSLTRTTPSPKDFWTAVGQPPVGVGSASLDPFSESTNPLSYLRDGSTQWTAPSATNHLFEPPRVPTPVQRPSAATVQEKGVIDSVQQQLVKPNCVGGEKIPLASKLNDWSASTTSSTEAYDAILNANRTSTSDSSARSHGSLWPVGSGLSSATGSSMWNSLSSLGSSPSSSAAPGFSLFGSSLWSPILPSAGSSPPSQDGQSAVGSKVAVGGVKSIWTDDGKQQQQLPRK